MIRRAQEADIKHMAQAFHRFSYSGLRVCGTEVSERDTLASVMCAMHSPKGIVLVAKYGSIVEGIAVAFVNDNFYNYSSKVGKIEMWAVSEETKRGTTAVKLFKAMERELEKHGVEYIQASYVGCNSPDYLKDVYRKMGYEPIETIFRREINNG